MNFSNASDISLSESMSGYVTCIEEDEGDNTHYLSVLSQNISLEEMNVTLSNTQTTDNDETLEENSEGVGQPVFFTIDGSNEIYGVQIARDEEGNLQKLQAQYTENVKGELVPMLETLQMLPLDDDVEVNNIYNATETTDGNVDKAGFKLEQEQATEDQLDEDLVLQKRSNNEQDFREEINTIDIKSEPLKLTCTKKEIEDFFTKTSTDEHVNECEIEEIDTDDQADSSNETNEQNDENDQIDTENIRDHFEQLFVEEDHVIETEEIENANSEECDNEIFHIVDNPEDVDIAKSTDFLEEPAQAILKETLDHQIQTNILRKSSQRSVLKPQSNVDQKVIYVQTIPEKENMGVTGIARQSKPNSRSLLLCNQPGQSLKKSPVDPLLIKGNRRPKRISRSKEAKEARQFINFINATTIPQVPERKERLPRKQQFKPLKHPNEDIVVKEMIVSSNGFVDPISAEEKKNLPVTEYVELLDSGDESGSDNQNRRKKLAMQKRMVEIEIIDSEEESDSSVIELDSTSKETNENSVTKQKRGRSSLEKNSKNDKKDPDSSSESPPKMSRTDSDLDSVTSTLKVISMENVEENNPMEVETNANEQSEATRNSKEIKKTEQPVTANAKRTSNAKPTESNKPLKKEFEYKYECEICKTKFINKFILNRHNCALKSGPTCDICKKNFPNITTLNVHARTHFKQPLLPKSDPKTKKIESSKIAVPRVSTRTSVIAKKTETRAETASKSTAADVKTGAIPKRPLRSTVKQASLQIEQNTAKVTPNKILKSSSLQVDMQCDKCPMKFTTNQAWFDHQVLKHDFKTPDKSIGEIKRKNMAKKVVVHSGVRAKSEVKQHFSILRNKFQLSQQD